MINVVGTLLFAVNTAKTVDNQSVKLSPIKRYYPGNVVKFLCPLCLHLSQKILDHKKDFVDDIPNDEKFKMVFMSEGISNCPCCGINLDWTNFYKKNGENK